MIDSTQPTEAHPRPDNAERSKLIYLDYAAAAPLCLPARLAVVRAAEHVWGNPSSVHGQGQVARGALDRARRQIAAALGVKPGELVLTSGATEANALAWRGVLQPMLSELPVFALFGAVEHPSVKAVADVLTAQGLQAEALAVDRDGLIDLERLRQQLTERRVALVSLQWVNQELGCVQPVAAAAQLAHEHGALVHCDATQGWGHLPLDVHSMAVDLLSVSGAKIGAPSGTGALWIKPGVRLKPVQPGHQEQGLRGGTENLLGLIGFGAAAEAVGERLNHAPEVRALRDQLWAILGQGAPVHRHADLPAELESGHILSVAFPGLEAPRLVMALDLAGVAASAGSACASGTQQPSPVLQAIGDGSPEWQSLRRGTVRFSLGPGLTAQDVDRAGQIILLTVKRLRERSKAGR